jgi:hypothetical protein
LVATYAEKVSAVKQRPAFERMLADAHRGKFQVVLVWSLDRRHRSMVGALQTVIDLDRRGVQVISVREPNLAAQTDAVDVVAPNILSLSHWARLHNGELYAAQPRVNWSVLLQRTFDVDVKTCPSCGGRLHVRAVVTEHETAAKILKSLARTRAPPRAA